MKKILFCFIVFTLKAQTQITFCPPGAKWNYLFDVYYVNSFIRSDNETLAYVRDSLVNGETCKVLSHTKYFAEMNPDTLPKLSLLKQKGDTVFYRNYTTQNVWQILYNFAATPGQSWKHFYVGSGSIVITNTITVNSVTTVTINGIPLRRLNVTSSLNPVNLNIFSFNITERFGSSRFFFYTYYDVSNWRDYFSDFLCYGDNSFGNHQFTGRACEFSNPLSLQNTILTEKKATLFPNPFTESLYVDVKDEIVGCTLQIIDATGRLRKEQVLSTESTRINTANLDKGLYLVAFYKEGKIIFTKRIVKI